jgi:hypothetical protein
MKKIGVVCFDDFNTLSSGWASISGEKAFRVNGIGDLNSSILWISNLPFYFYKKFNLIKNPNIYDHQFFRTSLKMICDELGLDDNNKEVCRVCSQIFQRVYSLGLKEYDLSLEDAEYRYNSALTTCILSSNIRQVPKGPYSAELVQAFKESTQQNQAMMGEPVKASRARSFSFPKGAYAREILSQRVPTNTNWSKLKDSEVNITIGTKEENKLKGSTSFFKMISEKYKDKCLFFKINVTYTSKFFRSFATFAMGSNYQRNWVTLPELIELAKYSIVEILEGYSCDSQYLKFDEIDLDADEYSYSRGLYLENLWTAYALAINNGEYFNPVGSYLRAYDRVYCLKAAYNFQKNNLRVGSYGTGRIVVYLKNSEHALATDIARSEGLLPPSNMVKKND